MTFLIRERILNDPLKDWNSLCAMLGVWRALIMLYSQQLDDCPVPDSLTRKVKHKA
jgi:hypothetical protein